MANEPISINIELTKPLTVFIEKLASGAGVLYEPKRIKRRAEAEAQAKMLEAKTAVKVSRLEQRALTRMLQVEGKRQENIENIVTTAIPLIEPNSKPENMEDDWISNFFEHAKLYSDEEMQIIWARILAGEATSPGTYTKRTINLVAELEKTDAILFTTLAKFAWNIGEVQPLIFDTDDQLYTNEGITFDALTHLESIGLIKFETLAGFKRYSSALGGAFVANYQGTSYILKIAEGKASEIMTGKVMLTHQGSELIQICSLEKVPGFEEFIVKRFEADGVTVTKYPI